jgi:hypothetical protein
MRKLVGLPLTVGIALILSVSGCSQKQEVPLEVTVDEALAKGGCDVFYKTPPLYTWEELDKNQLDELESQLAFMVQQFKDAARVNDAVIFEGTYIEIAEQAGFYLDQFLEGKDVKGEYRFIGAAIWESKIKEFCAQL